jgi:hypothetical protein
MTRYYKREIGNHGHFHKREIGSLGIAKGERREQPLRFGTNFAG